MTGDEAPQRDGGWEVPFSDDLLSRMVHHLSSLGVGERLPSERVLAETLGVSRTVLRGRLMRLEAIGVAERRSGSAHTCAGSRRPWRVTRWAMGMMANNLDAGSMMPVRVGLEREARRQAARRGDHINLARMAVALDTMRESADDHGFREADRDFHDALVAASGCPVCSSSARFCGTSSPRRCVKSLWTSVTTCTDCTPRLRGRAGWRSDRAMQAVDGHFDWLDAAIERGTFDRGSCRRGWRMWWMMTCQRAVVT